MNKILIDKEEYILANFDGEIEFLKNKINIDIKGNVTINEIINDNEDLNLTINVLENSTLRFNRFGVIKNKNTEIIINQQENSKVYYKDSFITNGKYVLDIKNNITKNNSISDILVRASAKENGTILINATGKVLKNTKNNDLKEDLRGLSINNNRIDIIPNLLIKSNEVIANHNVTIGNVTEEELFYLMSKGLNKEDAIKLLQDGFLISNFDLNFKEKVKEILN